MYKLSHRRFSTQTWSVSNAHVYTSPWKDSNLVLVNSTDKSAICVLCTVDAWSPVFLGRVCLSAAVWHSGVLLDVGFKPAVASSRPWVWMDLESMCLMRRTYTSRQVTRTFRDIFQNDFYDKSTLSQNTALVERRLLRIVSLLKILQMHQ